MKTFAIAALLALAATPALAQANGNLAPGGIVDGARAGINAAAGTAPDGAVRPGGEPGQQAATSGSKMTKRSGPGDAAEPAK